MRQRSPSPAALAIIEAGTTQQVIADRLGFDQSTVSLMLSGQRRPADSLIPTIRVLVGESTADHVARLLNVAEVSV